MAKTIPEQGCVLCFDFGEKRIGVAIGDLDTKIAHPITTIVSIQRKARFEAIETLVKQWQPVLFVVGLPAHNNGGEHEIANKAKKFANQLNGRFNLPFHLENEEFTSVEAASILHKEGIFGTRHRNVVDQAAAQLILQGFFDHLQEHKS